MLSCAGPGPDATVWHTGPSPGTAGSQRLPVPTGAESPLLATFSGCPQPPVSASPPQAPPCHPGWEGVPAEHVGVTVPVGTRQGQGGHTVSQPQRGCPGHRHTYIFSMSSFSSKAPGRSRLFPRTRTCRRGGGTPEAPGHQARWEPASATQKWTLLERRDSPGCAQMKKTPSVGNQEAEYFN